MVSKLWCALESPGELVKNTDASTPTYRLGLSRSGRGPQYMYFLTSSQVIRMQLRFETLAHLSSGCAFPKKKKGGMGVGISRQWDFPLPTNLLQSSWFLTWSWTGLLSSLSSSSTSVWTLCWILTAYIFPCMLLTYCFLCLGCSALHQTLCQAGGGGHCGQKDHMIEYNISSLVVQSKHLGMRIRATKDTYTLWQSYTCSITFFKMTLRDTYWPKVV